MDAPDTQRIDLPDLSAGTDLPESTVHAFRTRGHALIRGLATPEEVAAHSPALLETAPKGRYDHRPLDERDTYGKAFIQMFNLWTHDERVRQFVFARRFARAAAELLGVDAVRLYHDQALFKEPGGGFTPWHQDQYYWPLETSHTVTLWMPLVPVDGDLGTMEFAAGSHRYGQLAAHPIGDDSEAAFTKWVAQHELDVDRDGAMQPGDASFHAGWTLHRAGPNRSPRMREAMTIIYYADGTRVGALDHPARRFDRDTWLRGCEPGGLAAGPLNPVLYSRDLAT